MEGKQKVFGIDQSMGIGQSEDGFIEKLYHRYMSYYFMLNNDELTRPGICLYYLEQNNFQMLIILNKSFNSKSSIK